MEGTGAVKENISDTPFSAYTQLANSQCMPTDLGGLLPCHHPPPQAKMLALTSWSQRLQVQAVIEGMAYQNHFELY